MAAWETASMLRGHGAQCCDRCVVTATDVISTSRERALSSLLASCSFCSAARGDGATLVCGPTVAICDACVREAERIAPRG